MPKTNLAKMLSPEEMNILGEIESLVTELKQVASGNDEMIDEEEVMIEEAMDSFKQKEDEEGVDKEVNSPTANDSAEERLDEGTEITEQNESEVGKLLRKVRSIAKSNKPKQQRVTKSVVDSNQIAHAVLKQLAPVIKSVQEQNDAIEGILGALGFNDDIEKSLSQTVRKSATKPVVNKDADRIVEALGSLIEKQEKKEEIEDDPFIFRNNPLQKSRGELADYALNIFGPKLNQ